MLTFGAVSFIAPWALAAAITLPLIWWLLRVTPPAPRLIRFPAIRLLFGLSARQQTAARTPWWLVLLRLVLAALIILAVAHPLINAIADRTDGPLLLVIDDGWGAGRNWPARQQAVAGLLDRAERAGQPVALLTTAPPAEGGPVQLNGLLPAAEARALVQAIVPKPWPVDRRAATEALRDLAPEARRVVAWLADGLDDGQAEGFARRLQATGRLRIVLDPPAALPHLLLPPAAAAGELVPVVRRARSGGAETLQLRALDEAGHVLAREPLHFDAGAAEAAAAIALPTELRNRVARLDIEDETSAGAVLLLDERWRRRPVGLVTVDPSAADKPLLSDMHYVGRALAPYAELRQGAIAELLRRPLAVAVLPDVNRLPQAELAALQSWIGNGGMLVRFAGPLLARGPDPLLPVRLRGGGRTLGGALSWTAPMTLAPFAEGSPFAGLAIPEDVRVNAQVLAEPAPDLNGKTWARLADGTPLVTAERRGRGWLVLVHTTANPEWTSLGMSGLFVDLLRRLIGLSQGVAGEQDGRTPLPPAELLDGFGRLVPPGGNVAAITADAVGATLPSPRHPPGLYGTETGRRALNLGPALGTLRPFTPPAGAETASYAESGREIDLRPWLLAAALILAVLDMAIGLGLRGAFSRAAVAGLALLAAIPRAEAEDDAFALKATLETRLAYVITGDSTIDQMSRAGLAGLTMVLARRSTAVLAEPVGVDPEADPLLFFPLLYWPVQGGRDGLSEAAQAKVNDYMRHGGMILFDTADQGETVGLGEGVGGERLRRVTDGLNIPPLAPVTDQHVLTRAFYLLRDLPGRYAGGSVWVAREGERINDGVSSVVVGGNDWAAAWAMDERGAPLAAAVPGGEAQREHAYRFGINLVMYALTGNYKADQVHLPAILERLGQ